jgi:hypothetical protein
MFTVLVTRTVNEPQPGSDEISRAFEESWVGTQGYDRPDGMRQRRALAFQGKVVTADGRAISEAFIVDLPEDVTRVGGGPLAGTETRVPSPPLGVRQRRLTNTAQRKHPGLQGPRHWLRSSPDGSPCRIIVQLEPGWKIDRLRGRQQHFHQRIGLRKSNTHNAAIGGRQRTSPRSLCIFSRRTPDRLREAS